MIRAIFFDIGGTVHTQHASPACDRDFAQRVWTLLDQHGIATEPSPMQLLPHIDAGAKAYKRFCEDKLVELPPDQIWQAFLLRDYAVEPHRLQGLGEELCYLFDRYRKQIIPRAGLTQTLASLRQHGYRLGVISNIMSRTFVPRILEEHGVAQYFETLVLSSVCGVRKPRAEIFEDAIKEMGIERHEACYVGDTVSRDVIGVRNARWPLMIQIDNPLTYHKDAAYLDRGFEPDVRIGSLPELPGAVERFNQKLKEGA